MQEFFGIGALMGWMTCAWCLLYGLIEGVWPLVIGAPPAAYLIYSYLDGWVQARAHRP